MTGSLALVAARLHPEKVSSESIADFPALCKALDIEESDFATALALSADQRYHSSEVPKRDGSSRTVHNPHFLIRRIQRRINARIFARSSVVKWPDYVFGSVPNDSDPNSTLGSRDYVNCARQHCGNKSILSVDIKDFFDNIHRDLVTAIFSDFLKYPLPVSEVLADICCKSESIIQGALTSSYIATLCLFRTEGHLVKKLQHKGLVYTRLVDDIKVSSRVAGYDFNYALRQLEQLTSDAGLPLNLQKTKIQHAGMAPLMVHGLRVDFGEPRLPPDEPKRIRASVKNLELLAAGPGYRAIPRV
ncbi:reverse transcriptase family protein [Aquabacterium sp. OR-4]|uniref:reverse transcriptase family protein n=1 Tax=Aquabacterium sp. OR-4 TaxID=2978127 RepID=UPI0021B3D94C|nr:reverse transcriptase family protein [Aquabacterium sp. OR-4]MDT7836163.1 reverse transcriptase family protein [Aquabacterium sp. OR-4]